MRYGIVREDQALPPPAQQQRLLEAAGCDVILQQGAPTALGERRLRQFLFGIQAGDEVVVHSLDVFMRSTGELARMIRTLLEIGAILRIANGPDDVDELRPEQPVTKVVSLLAEHEVRRPSRPPAGASSHSNAGSRNSLSPYQIDYARKLHAEGSSLRTIGLLFQVSPNEVWELISE